ncbi:hypothetical protein [Primorskyibacter marinus]|nr:hypothetical protein [Primorskyibacter marinus]
MSAHTRPMVRPVGRSGASGGSIFAKKNWQGVHSLAVGDGL